MRSTSRTGPRKVRTFDTKDHQTMAELHLGDKFLIRLPENPEIGFGWGPDVTPGLEVVDSWFEPVDLARPLAGGYHYWKIRAVSPGRHLYRANYRRRNYRGHIPPIVYQLQIDVSSE